MNLYIVTLVDDNRCLTTYAVMDETEDHAVNIACQWHLHGSDEPGGIQVYEVTHAESGICEVTR
jgi:hypothetical protein